MTVVASAQTTAYDGVGSAVTAVADKTLTVTYSGNGQPSEVPKVPLLTMLYRVDPGVPYAPVLKMENFGHAKVDIANGSQYYFKTHLVHAGGGSSVNIATN